MDDHLKQSDYILCKNIQDLQFKHKRENDVKFMSLLSKPLPCCIRDVNEEYKIWTDTFKTRTPNCSEIIATRGGNNKKSGVDKQCGGYECYQGKYNNNFLLLPCKENTFQNYLVEDNEKICSVSHQMFNNMTKRV